MIIFDSDRKYVFEYVANIKSSVNTTKSKGAPRADWKPCIMEALNRIIDELHEGKFRKLLEMPIHTNTCNANLINAYWIWVYHDFSTWAQTNGFSGVTFHQMKDKSKESRTE
ncbi:uncharacterized protein LOC111716725 [Eurytemora carolleeae]|uniref:uncharacterized protein LOC111716725 n=1 Tax=Eurytemora carolleeae TaxID=1294199 RepID=UPI000C7617E4|nr:uncharacterized protein LOC111716725 [Eurytemora carolleeae]|eukprot:XP_023347968.1 uncharacterized protein LOC111716725 [Eurytemora affinis]